MTSLGGLPRRVMAIVVILTTRELCKERNDKIFNNRSTTPSNLVAKIKKEGKALTLVGAKCLEHFTIV